MQNGYYNVQVSILEKRETAAKIIFKKKKKELEKNTKIYVWLQYLCDLMTYNYLKKKKKTFQFIGNGMHKKDF